MGVDPSTVGPESFKRIPTGETSSRSMSISMATMGRVSVPVTRPDGQESSLG